MRGRVVPITRGDERHWTPATAGDALTWVARSDSLAVDASEGSVSRARSGILEAHVYLLPGRAIRVLILVVLAMVAGAATAQGPGSAPPAVIANPDMLARDLELYANADKFCWTRGEPVSVDWLAERDAGYRRGAFSRYHLSELEDGWRWARRDASRGPDLRAADGAVRGVPNTDLEVHARGVDEGWALYTIDSELAVGQVRFEWTAPPQKICMSDGISVRASAEVVAGEPGARQVGFVLPLTTEQRLMDGAEVKACSPQSTTGVDSEVGYLSDEGRCERQLYHLDPTREWTFWVKLPESFYVIYSYVPEGRRE